MNKEILHKKVCLFNLEYISMIGLDRITGEVNNYFENKHSPAYK